jgi:hypothetical protein
VLKEAAVHRAAGAPANWSTHKKFKISTHRLFEYAIVVFTGSLCGAFITVVPWSELPLRCEQIPHCSTAGPRRPLTVRDIDGRYVTEQTQ